MKKTILFAVLLSFVVGNLNAQDDNNTTNQPNFGMKGGYTSITLRVSADGNSASDDVSGFYIGTFAEFNLSDKLDFQPELTYASYSEDGESTGVIFLPLLAKYKANEQFSLLAGPQLDYLVNEEDSEGLNRIGLGIAIGAAYDITEQVFIDARYSFGLSNRLDGDLPGLEEFDIKTKFNYFQIGLGYRF